MSEKDLTGRDRKLLDYLEVSKNENGNGTGEHRTVDEPAQSDDLRKRNRDLEARVQELERELQDLREEHLAWKKTFASRLNELGAKVEGGDPTDPRSRRYYEDLTIIEKYAQMGERERDDLLSGSASKRRAVLIFENWKDWSKNVAAGQVISTNHTRGQYNTIALKVDLQSATGETLHNREIYRAMKALAKLSVTEVDEVECVTDSTGRQHITGGAFEFHEKVNPDSGEYFKVVKLADSAGVTFL